MGLRASRTRRSTCCARTARVSSGQRRRAAAGRQRRRSGRWSPTSSSAGTTPAGEKLLFEQLKHPPNPQQKHWLTQRLYELYETRIRNDGEVSLGSGADALSARRRQAIRGRPGDRPIPNHRNNLLNRLCAIYRTAHEKKLPGVADDLRAFAFQRFPEVHRHAT